VQGYLNGVFQVEQIVDTCVAKDILKGFGVRFFEADRLIYTNAKQGDNNPGNDPLRVVREICFPGKIWRLDLVPTAAIYPPGTFRNLGLLIFGLAASAILSFLLHFLIQRMQMYRQARDLALHEDFGDRISADGEKYINYISDAARKMELLINDLLELTRIGRLTVEKTEFPFAGVIEEGLKALQPRIRARGIQVNVAENLPLVYGEKKRIVQVMENLLSKNLQTLV
jgi:hypothetical protein